MGFTNPIHGNNVLTRKRVTDQDDIRGATLKVCRERFGTRHPVRVESVRNGVVRMRVPSSPWKMELLWNEREILSRVQELLNVNNSTVRRIAVYL